MNISVRIVLRKVLKDGQLTLMRRILYPTQAWVIKRRRSLLEIRTTSSTLRNRNALIAAVTNIR
jgi:hypothetical protein